MRCDECGAHNPVTAVWCTQCYTSLTSAPPTASPEREEASPVMAGRSSAEPEVEDVLDEGGYAPGGGLAERGPRGPIDVGERRFRKTEEGVDWRCDLCQEWSPIELTACRSCGTEFRRALSQAHQETAGKDVSENTVMLATLALPGLGHWLLGRGGAGIARGLTFVLWFLGGLMILREASRSGVTALPAIALLLGALIIWATTLVDTLALARGQNREILTGRVFTWLVVGVIGMVMVFFLSSAATLT